MESIINWAALQRLSMPGRAPGAKAPDGSNPWDNNSVYYNKMVLMEQPFTLKQLECFPVSPDNTLLDIGCGPGRITVPMAQRVKKVTALDASTKMLDICMGKVKDAGLTNVQPLLMDWSEEEALKALPKHDIVIASRSIGVHDLRKLNRFSKKICVMIGWANAPSIPEIISDLFVGTSGVQFNRPRQPDRALGYNVMWNVCYDLGFDPNIRILDDGYTKDFSNEDEAFDYLITLRPPIPEEEMPIFRDNVRKYLTDSGHGVTFYHPTRSFVIWWEANPDIE